MLKTTSGGPCATLHERISIGNLLAALGDRATPALIFIFRLVKRIVPWLVRAGLSAAVVAASLVSGAVFAMVKPHRPCCIGATAGGRPTC